MFTTLISPGFLAANSGWRAIDCRHELLDPQAGRRAYDVAHIPGAIHAHLDEDLAGARTGRNGRHPLPDAEDLRRWLGNAGITRQTPVVAYDGGDGAYAARLWWLLRWLGHARTCVLDGGWAAWEAQDRSRTTEVPQFPKRIYAGEPNWHMVATTDQVAANLADHRFMVLDARGAGRFAGAEEPIDPVAGHIPGAINRPYAQNLEAARFKSAETLRAEFIELLRGTEPAAIVHQCGSGVTACHNLLAMEHAGLHGSRLYAGSWSEWCSDPGRPVEKQK